MGVRDTTM